MARVRVAGIDLEARRIAPGLEVWVPAEPDALLEALDEETFRATDERLPYFASLWPAGVALARHLLDGPSLEGRRALDLGCGIGVVGLAALFRGAEVVFFDWEPRALAIVAHAAARQGLVPAALVPGDWRDPPALGRFDRILAADVLYEARNLPAVAAFLARHLAPGAEAWLADPGRQVAEGFEAGLAGTGLRVLERRPLAGPVDGVASTLTRVASVG